MRYKLAFDTVFDTKTKKYSSVAEGFDEDAIGKYIIFNICLQGNVKACDFADVNKYSENKSFDKIVTFLKAKKVPYVIDAETDYSDIKNIKVAKGLADKANKAIEREHKKVEKASQNKKAQVYDMENVNIAKDSKKAHEELEKQYQSNINELRLVNTDGLTNENDILNDDELLRFRETHLMKAFKIVKDNYPLYYTLLSALEKKYVLEKDSPICSTLAVTSACELIINVHFALSLTVQQLVFILCHEASHIALKHIPRCMAFEQDPDSNNIAGDLIINKMLADDFKIQPGSGNSNVEFPNIGLYDKDLDLETETLESLYAKIAGEKSRLADLLVIQKIFEELLQKRFAIAIGLAVLKSSGTENKLVEVIEDKLKDFDNMLASVKI